MVEFRKCFSNFMISITLFLICTAYRPPNATPSWIDLLEEELSAAQTTGLELILMGDINIDLHICSSPHSAFRPYSVGN